MTKKLLLASTLGVVALAFTGCANGVNQVSSASPSFTKLETEKVKTYNIQTDVREIKSETILDFNSKNAPRLIVMKSLEPAESYYSKYLSQKRIRQTFSMIKNEKDKNGFVLTENRAINDKETLIQNFYFSKIKNCKDGFTERFQEEKRSVPFVVKEVIGSDTKTEIDTFEKVEKQEISLCMKDKDLVLLKTNLQIHTPYAASFELKEVYKVEDDGKSQK